MGRRIVPVQLSAATHVHSRKNEILAVVRDRDDSPSPWHAVLPICASGGVVVMSAGAAPKDRYERPLGRERDLAARIEWAGPCR